MELILPAKQNAPSPVVVDTKVLVVIGANGAGKSSFGRDLQRRYRDNAEMISGLHSLFLCGGEKSNLSEYEKLTLRLQREEFEAAVSYKEACKRHADLIPPVTKIDRIQTVWEKMFPHNRLVRKSGFVELASVGRDGSTYNAGRMSDGEKIVFYLIGAVLCARPSELLIIEEPEILLHNSIKNVLWDEIEALRPDCTYVYLTHDIDFATSRPESKRIWIRDYDADARMWDYRMIEESGSLPEEVYIDILGSRRPILFVEGTNTNSIDNRLYPLIFPDFLVKPMGGCQKVIETTKAFRQLQDFHTLDSMGIVDRDRRTQGEIDYLREQHIFVPDVAEVENLLMLEPVIKTVARRLMKDPEQVFEEVKENVVKLFEKDLESQVILHAKHRVRRKLETTVDKKITTVEQLTEHVESICLNMHVDGIYRSLKDKFTRYVEKGDYKSILRVYNQKGMLPQSRLCGICGISNKENYLNLVLSILKENKEDAEIIRSSIKESLGA